MKVEHDASTTFMGHWHCDRTRPDFTQLSAVEASRQLLAQHDRERSIARYVHPNHVCDRDDKLASYRAVCGQSSLHRAPVGERGSVASRMDRFLIPGKDEIYHDKPYAIAPPKGDDRSMWRDTVMSLGSYPDHRSNRHVDPYDGCYAVLGGTEAGFSESRT